MARIILFNKPYGVLSQFTDREAGRATLADYLEAPGFRPAGRLDRDSEGLLVLTDDGRLQQQIANPRHRHWKTYLVQVEGTPEADRLRALRDGLPLKDGATLPAQVRPIPEPDWLWPRDPPVRERLSVPDCWLEIRLQEGRNRQVRRMTAAVGLPTLRLVRVGVGEWSLGELAPGGQRALWLSDASPGNSRRPTSDRPRPGPRPDSSRRPVKPGRRRSTRKPGP